VAPDRIVVMRYEDGWCVRGGGALFQKTRRREDALRTANAHARAQTAAGRPLRVVVNTELRDPSLLLG
jgi:hypothetical protein